MDYIENNNNTQSMRLVKISISNFRSIINAKEIYIDQNVTTLVGANEHGKSNILNAIKYLDTSYEFDYVKDVRYDQAANLYYPQIDYQVVFSEKEKLDLEILIAGIYSPVYSNDTNVEYDEPKEIPQIRLTSDTYVLRRTYTSTEAISTLIDVEEDHFKKDIIKYIENYFKGRMIYFDDFNDRLPSLITQQELNDDGNLIVKGLLKLSGLDVVRTKIFEDSLQSRNLVNRLFIEAPAKITAEVVKNWFQGLTDTIRILIHRNASNQTLRIDIEDKNTIVELDSRSRGFRWYLSFFLKYRAYSDGDLMDCIFLLDEPGLFLHPRGQKDLLSFFEILSKYNQIVYTTHSPFMINRLNKSRVRVIEKFENLGTQVNAKGFISNWKPLRSSLGLTLSDSFFYADNTLLVEGPEDKIYILTLLQLYSKAYGKDIDLNILSIIDAGGASELPAIARIIGEEDRPYIVLIDSDSNKSINKLKKIVKNINHLKEIKDIKDGALVIQELLPKIIYEQAVNNYIDLLVLNNSITQSEGKEKKSFVANGHNRIDKAVDAFVLEQFNEDDVSKVGIANEFEKIVLADGFYCEQKEFDSAFKLTEWVINQLKLDPCS